MTRNNIDSANFKNKFFLHKGRLKLIGILVLVLIILAIGFQNREEVTTRIIFFTITMPRFVLLLITAVFGFIIGVLFSLHYLGKSGGEQQEIE